MGPRATPGAQEGPRCPGPRVGRGLWSFYRPEGREGDDADGTRSSVGSELLHFRHTVSGARALCWKPPSARASRRQPPAPSCPPILCEPGTWETPRFLVHPSAEQAACRQPGLRSASQDVRSGLYLCASAISYGASVFLTVKWGFARLRLTWRGKMLQHLCGTTHHCWYLKPWMHADLQGPISSCS